MVLAVLVLDANDPLAVVHDDAREPEYSAAYRSYVDSILERVRLVYYGQDRTLIKTGALDSTIGAAMARSESLYPFVGDEFYRTGELRSWRTLDDRSVTFGVAGVFVLIGPLPRAPRTDPPGGVRDASARSPEASAPSVRAESMPAPARSQDPRSVEDR